MYKARDSRLERTVAVKVLPQHLSSSVEVRQRFVDLDTQGGGLRLGAPRPIFGRKPPPRGPFDATRDGKRLLFAAPLEDTSSAQIRFVSDWRADLGAK